MRTANRPSAGVREMNKIAVAVLSVAVVVLLLPGVWFAARAAGHPIDLSVMAVMAALLAAACSAALVAVTVFGRPVGGHSYQATRLNEDPVWRFIVPFKEPAMLPVLARPGVPVDILLVRNERVFKNPVENAGRKILLTIKKAKKGGPVFNPVYLKQLFETLKGFTKSEHVILLNEHDEFMGYIPWANAVKEFTGDNAESKIAKNIVEVLDDPSKSTRLRALGGMATQDLISDADTIHEAAKKTWNDDPMHGLVVYHANRNRKLVGIIARNAVLQLVSTGA
jgi:hypothetical protein